MFDKTLLAANFVFQIPNSFEMQMCIETNERNK